MVSYGKQTVDGNGPVERVHNLSTFCRRTESTFSVYFSPAYEDEEENELVITLAPNKTTRLAFTTRAREIYTFNCKSSTGRGLKYPNNPLHDDGYVPRCYFPSLTPGERLECNVSSRTKTVRWYRDDGEYLGHGNAYLTTQHTVNRSVSCSPLDSDVVYLFRTPVNKFQAWIYIFLVVLCGLSICVTIFSLLCRFCEALCVRRAHYDHTPS